MSDLSPAPEQAEELDDATVGRLLGATDEESLASLSEWLEANPRTWPASVARVTLLPVDVSVESSCAVLGALTQRTPTDEETTLQLVTACLTPIALRISESLAEGGTGAVQDDSLVSVAVGIVTSSRRSKLSKGAIGCLAQTGPGGALVLTRAFDAVRAGSKVQIVQNLDPADVLELSDNAVASLSSSVARLVVDLVGRERDDANRFLAQLGWVEPVESSQIEPSEPLAVGAHVFHATWGAGAVVASDPESVTIDFGSAGQRTLLRAYATLRHVE